MPYDSNSHCRVDFVDLAGIPLQLGEPEPLNFCDRIIALLNEREEPLKDYILDAPDMLYPWNLYWTDTARQEGGLSIHDPVIADHRTRYKGWHIDCEDQEVCYYKHNFRGTHTTIGKAAAALSSIVTAI
jgi:hypothetical protein